MKSLLQFALSALLVLDPASLSAFETDQFNLPPVPLADIGDEVSDHVVDGVSRAIARVNSEIAFHARCAGRSTRSQEKCGDPEAERKTLAYLRSDDAVALEVFKLLGDGIFPLSHIGKWLTSHRFQDKPSTYKTSYQDSIYILSPTNYITISPTVKLYGSELGTDKIEHIFQQGYSYYKIYKRSTASGLSAEDAVRRSVKWGQMTERTYFGFLVSGVYSNADLYANYAGLKFYLGLTHPVTMGDHIRPPMLRLIDGLWKINAEIDLSAATLRPFISDHLNEALNPSGFTELLFPSVRNVVRKRSCPQWRKVYSVDTGRNLDVKSRELRLWNGEDYGYTEKHRMISVGELCFSDGN